MRELKVCYFALLIIALVSSNAIAQNFSSSINRINADSFPSIKAIVKIWNEKPEILKDKNFKLVEDTIHISTFSVEIMKPKQFVIILLDRSSSIKPALKTIKLAASSFATKMTKSVALGLISFASDIEHEQSFTFDADKIIKSIQKIRSWGGTSLYDALYEACVEINLKAGRNDLKTIVCLTDGIDSTPAGNKPISIKKPKDVIEHAIKNNIRLVMLGLGNDIDAEILKSFAQSTNGWFLQPQEASDLAELYSSISERLLQEKYYRIRYLTPKPIYDGKKHSLKIICSFNGKQDQGISSYITPVEVDSKNQKKVFNTVRIRKGTLKLPESKYLSDAILVPSPSPVFIPNKASFANQNAEECDAIIQQATGKITKDCNDDLDKQYVYLDDFKKHLDILKSKIDVIYEKKQYQPHEIAMVNCRYEILNNRMIELGAKREKCYEIYNLRLQNFIDILTLLKREYVKVENVSPLMYEELRSKKKIEEARVNKIYLQKEEKRQHTLEGINRKYSRILIIKTNKGKHLFRSKTVKENIPTFTGKFRVTNQSKDEHGRASNNISDNNNRSQKTGIDLSIPPLKTTSKIKTID